MTYAMPHTSTPNLAPRRALLHPLFLGALAALATNDHFLKGSGLLPAAVTGKLSDFAGLLVAPVLLAALLSARSRPAFAACHIVVGGVFSAIQLSHGAANTWSALMGLVGVPWAITSDPTDLIALSVLPISYRVFAEAARHPTRRTVRRALEWTSATVGLAFCVATSPAHPPFDRIYDGRVFLYNETDRALTIQVQRLREDLSVDCPTALDDPGHTLAPSLFDTAEIFRIDPDEALALWGRFEGTPVVGDGCQVLRVSMTGAPDPFLVPVDLDGFPDQSLDAEAVLDFEHTIRVTEEDGILTAQGGDDDLVVEVGELRVAGAPGTCREQSDADRLAWDLSNLTNPSRLEALVASPDGCLRLDVASQAMIDAGIAPDRNYLCMPQRRFPFEVGDWLDFEGYLGAVEIALSQATDPPPTEDRVLVLARTASDGTLGALPADLEAAPGTPLDCAPAVYDTCGTVAVETTVTFARPELGGVAEARVGDIVTLDGSDGSTVQGVVIHALERRIYDPACVTGSQAPEDVEIVTVYRKPLP